MRVFVLCALMFAVFGPKGLTKEDTIQELCACALESAERTINYEEAFIASRAAGRVRSPTRPLGNAIVALTDSDYEKVIGYVRTEENGMFSFSGLKEGDHHIFICKSGFNVAQGILRIDFESENKEIEVLISVS